MVYPPKLTWQWKIRHEWRCISYWQWVSNVMLVFREVILPFSPTASGDLPPQISINGVMMTHLRPISITKLSCHLPRHFIQIHTRLFYTSDLTTEVSARRFWARRFQKRESPSGFQTHSEVQRNIWYIKKSCKVFPKKIIWIHSPPKTNSGTYDSPMKQLGETFCVAM